MSDTPVQEEGQATTPANLVCQETFSFNYVNVDDPEQPGGPMRASFCVGDPGDRIGTTTMVKTALMDPESMIAIGELFMQCGRKNLPRQELVTAPAGADVNKIAAALGHAPKAWGGR